MLTYLWDKNHRLTRRWSKAKGYTYYTYDANGNLTYINYPTGTPDVTFSYNAGDQMTQMTDGMGTTYFGYTGNGQISYENAPWASDVVTYSYHSYHGRRSKLEVQQPGTGNWAIDYSYDYDRRLDILTSPAGQFDYDYIGAGRNIDTLTLPGGQYIDYGQDLVGRVDETILKSSGGSAINAHAYNLNLAGWKTQQSLPDTSTVAYDYDNIGQLTGADASGGGVDFEYAYDTAWNLDWRKINTTTEDFSVNSKNEVTSSPLGNPTHDSNGNLTAMGTSGSWPTYTYDAENRLVSAEWYTTYPEWTRKVTYSYDGLSRLRKRLVQDYSNGYLYATISDTRYLYDGMLVIEERNASNTPVARYTRGLDLSGSLQGAGGIGGLLAREWGSNDAYYHADAQGNVTALINYSGTVMATYLYDSFGNLLSSSGTWAAVNKYRFSSKEIDDTGLNYYGYRFYHPDLQRWLNRDPFGDAGSLASRSFNSLQRLTSGAPWETKEPNLFRIIYNNPQNLIDPDGRWGIQFGDGPNIGWGDPSLIFDDWDDFVDDYTKGAAIAADVLIPFADPYSDFYDPCDAIVRSSQRLAHAGKLIGETAALMGIGQAVARAAKVSYKQIPRGLRAIAGRGMVRDAVVNGVADTAIGPLAPYIFNAGEAAMLGDTINDISNIYGNGDCP